MGDSTYRIASTPVAKIATGVTIALKIAGTNLIACNRNE